MPRDDRQWRHVRHSLELFAQRFGKIAHMCGMRFLPPMMLYGAQSASRDAVAQHVKTFTERLQSYPDWPELDDLEQCAACVVPMKDRPAEAPDIATAGAR